MKVIIVGAPAAGKTTLKKYLNEHYEWPIIEQDDELKRLNNGLWPNDEHLREQILIPQIHELVLNLTDVVFITPYFRPDLLLRAKDLGFKTVLLQLDLAELHRRNQQRMAERPAKGDASRWFDSHFEYVKKILDENLIDLKLDGSKPTQEIAEELSRFLEG